MSRYHIRLVTSSSDVQTARLLWREYWTELGFTDDFQSFRKELEGLPGVYQPPHGALWVAAEDDVGVGTIAVRPLHERACEAKRLYVRRDYRRTGIGRALLEHAIHGARSMGYEVLYGDTLARLMESRALYACLGFQEVGPYSDQPTPQAIYLRLAL